MNSNNEDDLCPAYDGQDLSVFTVLMVHHAASRLGLTREGLNRENEMRDCILQIKPEVPGLIDYVMEAYRKWMEAKSADAELSILSALQKEIDNRRAELSVSISN